MLEFYSNVSLRRMAVLVGRAIKVIKAGEGRETARRLGREQLEKPPARTGGFFESVRTPAFFLAALPLVLARFAREFRRYAARVPGSTKPPCYAGYSNVGYLVVSKSRNKQNQCKL